MQEADRQLCAYSVHSSGPLLVRLEQLLDYSTPRCLAVFA